MMHKLFIVSFPRKRLLTTCVWMIKLYTHIYIQEYVYIYDLIVHTYTNTNMYQYVYMYLQYIQNRLYLFKLSYVRLLLTVWSSLFLSRIFIVHYIYTSYYVILATLCFKLVLPSAPLCTCAYICTHIYICMLACFLKWHNLQWSTMNQWKAIVHFLAQDEYMD